MHKAGENDEVSEFNNIERDVRPRVTAERFLEYSRGVLAELKDDIAQGRGIEQSVIASIEQAIRRHEPTATREPEDLSRQIDGLKRFGSTSQQRH